jgi:hypothetical protein
MTLITTCIGSDIFYIFMISFYKLMYLTFAFCIPDDDHIVSRSMQELIVCRNELKYTCVHLLVSIFYIKFGGASKYLRRKCLQLSKSQ